MALVTASTRLCLMIGHPIEKARTPAVFNQWAAMAGCDVIMTGLSLEREGIAPFFAAMRHWENCIGAIVTYPHKQLALEQIDEADAAARFSEACNVVRRNPDGRLVGTMTDGVGCVSAMKAHGVNLVGADFLLIGAGGAGSAIAHEVARRGATRIVVNDLDAMRRDTLLGRLGSAFPQLVALALPPDDFRFDVVCNATPVGMNGETGLPFPVERLPAHALVVDAVPTPAMTPWLEAARQKDLRVQTGPEMVAGQFGHVAGHLLGLVSTRIDPAGAIRGAA